MISVIEVVTLIDVLQKAADFGQGLGATYVELRVESLNRSNLQYEDGRVRSNSQRIEEGASIRVLQMEHGALSPSATLRLPH